LNLLDDDCERMQLDMKYVDIFRRQFKRKCRLSVRPEFDICGT
jgi:hypothetical protein